jgi:hypothetical protein
LLVSFDSEVRKRGLPLDNANFGIGTLVARIPAVRPRYLTPPGMTPK